MSNSLTATLVLIALAFVAIVLGHFYARGRRGGAPGFPDTAVASPTAPDEAEDSLLSPSGEEPLEHRH